MKNESSFDISDGAEKPEIADAASIEDLGRSAVVTIRGKSVTVKFDLGEITPRLRRKLEKISNSDDDTEAADVSVEYLAAVVNSWDLTDKEGQPVPVTIDGIEGVSYRDLGKLTEAVNTATLPNASGGQDSPALSSSSREENSPLDSAEG